jgi:hypothetical protein
MTPSRVPVNPSGSTPLDTVKPVRGEPIGRAVTSSTVKMDGQSIGSVGTSADDAGATPSMMVRSKGKMMTERATRLI